MVQFAAHHAVVALGVAAGLTLGLLARQRRRFGHWTGVALLPWMVAAGLAVALASSSAPFAPVVDAVTVHLWAVTTAGLLWLPFRHAALHRDGSEAVETLAGTGAGASLVLGAAVVTRSVAVGSTAAWLAGAPLVAAVVALLGYLIHDRVDPIAVGKTRMLGLVVLFATALLGVAVAVAVSAGTPGGYSSAAASVVGRGPAALVALVVGHLVAGFAVVSLAGRVVRRTEAGAHLLSTAVAAVGVGASVAVLVRVTLM